MRVNSIIKSNNGMHRYLNNIRENKREKNNENDISFYEILKQNISERMEKNSTTSMNTKNK